ncbi:MAG: hypothetical protein CML20_14285 [Rheinheimera sp.]|mgnify:CR=1 FL=1|nr:hypothetical protein [Rheinheimera sp.]|tara:strand:- start:96914 stop:97156 length:243 start_codon:yes stop_codon:yes gene_type:complete
MFKRAFNLNLIIFSIISLLCALGAELYFQVRLDSTFWLYANEKGELASFILALFNPWLGFPFALLATYLKFKKDSNKIGS